KSHINLLSNIQIPFGVYPSLKTKTPLIRGHFLKLSLSKYPCFGKKQSKKEISNISTQNLICKTAFSAAFDYSTVDYEMDSMQEWRKRARLSSAFAPSLSFNCADLIS